VDSAETHFVYLHLLRAATGAWLDAATWAQFREQAARYAADDRRYEAAHYRGSTLSAPRLGGSGRAAAPVLRRQWNDFFDSTTTTMLITPVPAPPRSRTTSTANAGSAWSQSTAQPQARHRLAVLGRLPGVVGLPATAVPLGCAADGLPVGAQVIGPAMADPDTACVSRSGWSSHWRGFEPPPMATSTQGDPHDPHREHRSPTPSPT
jgi:amidase